MPGPGWFYIDANEVSAVVDAVESKYLSRYRFDAPPEEETSRSMRLEAGFARWLGVSHVLAVNSGTSALLCALRGLGIGPGDEVIVPGYTFVASMAAVLHLGARVVLAEVDESLTLNPDDVRRKLSPRTKAIMAVHMIGSAANLTEIQRLANDTGCALVEDVAQALGGRYQDRPLGSIGDVGCFSLNVSKTITAGEGGLLSTSNAELYERAYAFHDHGFSPARRGIQDDGRVLGLNLRLNELGAAVALAQLSKLDFILSRMRRHATVVRRALGSVPYIEERSLNDPEGDCGTAHVVLFRSKDVAAEAAVALGGKCLCASPKHNYASIPQLQLYRDSDDWSRPSVRYCQPGDLPNTDSILQRALAVGIGLADNYLGTVGDIRITDSPQIVEEKAARIAATIADVTTRHR